MKLYVGNLSSKTTEEQLKSLVAAFGAPLKTEIVFDRITGQSRGFAFVDFPNDDEARSAVAGLNGKEVDGNVLTVNESRQKRLLGGGVL